jgi:putative transposase
MDKLPRRLYPQRTNLRLRSYNYAWQGDYFVTICTQNRRCLFGQIAESTMKLNQFGEVLESVWKEIPFHYPEISNEIFKVMPNHIHGIITIRKVERAGSKPAPTKPYHLSEIVRAFKTYSSRKINDIRRTQGTTIWQRNYYEHIIRDESDYRQIVEYILFNPAKWEADPENPAISTKSPISSPEG